MIITAEVLDRPKLSFVTQKRGLAPPLGQESFKRATSPTALLSDSKKLRGSSTQVTTYPRVPHSKTDAERQVTTATLLLTTPENSADAVDSLKCDPYVVSARLNSPNIRVEPKLCRRKSSSPPVSLRETDTKETAEEWLERLHSKRHSPQKVNFLHSKNTVNDQKTTPTPIDSFKHNSENGLHISKGEPSGGNHGGKKPSKNNKKTVLDLVISRRKSNTTLERVENEVHTAIEPENGNESGCILNNCGKTSEYFLRLKKGDSISVKVQSASQVSPSEESCEKPSVTITKNNASAKRPKVCAGFENGPKKFRSRDTLSASVPPSLRNKARNISKNAKFEDLVELRNNGDSGSLDRDNKSVEQPPSSKSRKNSFTDAWLRFRRSSAANNKGDSVGSKRCSISGCSGKRPSICALQDNKDFIEKLRCRNNSLVGEDARARSNSLTNVVNFRQNNRKISKNKKRNNVATKTTPEKNASNQSSSTESGSSKEKRTSATKAVEASEGWKKVGTKRMGKTTTTTETRTFKKGSRWYKETKVTTVVEHKTGTNTSTKITTEELPGPPKDSSSSSDSSRSPSPVRTTKKTSASSGLLSKLKDKVKASGSSDDEEERDQELSRLALRKVNEKRTLHGVRALKLSDKLNDEAKKWAKHLALLDKMEHKNDSNFGENIYKLSSNVPISWERRIQADPISHWYEEVKLHKFGQEPTGGKLDSGHFSQLVWKNVTEFGFGTAASASGLNVYFVAFFSPKGNWMGEFATQVPPVGGFPKDSFLNNVTSKLQKAAVGDNSSSSSDDEEDFAAAVLEAHNDYRSKHGVSPLKISKKLNKTAEDWAKIIAKRNRLEHRPNNNYGENIYSKWNSKPNQSLKGKEPVDSWYSEIKNHVFGKEPTSLATGHFTQVVWEDSRELGVGMARNKSAGKLYVVCNYNPPGNIVGGFATKVPRAKS